MVLKSCSPKSLVLEFCSKSLVLPYCDSFWRDCRVALVRRIVALMRLRSCARENRSDSRNPFARRQRATRLIPDRLFWIRWRRKVEWRPSQPQEAELEGQRKLFSRAFSNAG